MSSSGFEAALEEFVEAIDSTGGIYYEGNTPCPVGDPDWSDLGEAYLRACVELGREPLVSEPDDEDNHIFFNYP